MMGHSLWPEQKGNADLSINDYACIIPCKLPTLILTALASPLRLRIDTLAERFVVPLLQRRNSAKTSIKHLLCLSPAQPDFRFQNTTILPYSIR